MSTKTAEFYTYIQNAVRAGQTRICPAIFSFCFPRASVSAAFRMAKQNGIIEVAYIGGTGVPVYQAAGTIQAVAEATNGVKH